MPLFVLLLFSFAYAGFSALHGIDIDQMILYQAALRIVQGQVLYQDFYIPHGPIGAYILAGFVRIAPSGGTAMILASALLNSLACFCIWDITKRNTEGLLFPALAAFLTAIWFLPVFGTFYYDHLSYFFVLLSFIFYSRSSHWIQLLAASFFLVLAFHTKQTVGLGAILALLLAILLSFNTRELFSKRNLLFLLYYLMGHLLVLLTISLIGNLSNYLEHTFHMPMQFAFDAGADKSFFNLVKSCIFPFKIIPLEMFRNKGWGRLAFYPVVIGIYFSYWVVIRGKLKKETKFTLLFLILSTLFCSALLGRLFAHVFFASAGILMISFSTLPKKQSVYVSITSTLILTLIGIAYTQYLRPFNSATDTFYAETDLYPLQIRDSHFATASKEAISYLKKSPGSFALFTDSAYLIPLALRQSALNSTLYYHDGLTVPLRELPRRNWQISAINQLSINNVKYVFVSSPLQEGIRPLSSTTVKVEPLVDLQAYLNQNYHLVLSEPYFTLLQKN